MSTGLIETFHKLSHKHPDKNIFTYLNDGKTPITMTYGELDYKARQIASVIKTMGKPGDTVLLMYPPGLDFITAFLGGAYAQMILVPVMPPLNQEVANKLAGIIDNAKPVVCLTNRYIYKKLSKLKIILPPENSFKEADVSLSNQLHSQIKIGPFSLQCLATDSIPEFSMDNFVIPDIDPASPLFLQYTSGSTGNPKGVIVTHRAMQHNLTAIKYACNVDENYIFYSWLPQYHDLGLIGFMLEPMFTGAYAVLGSPLKFLSNPMSWLQGISKYRCIISAAPNFAFELCLRKATEEQKKELDLSCWKIAPISAEPIRESTVRRFSEAFKSCGFKTEAFYPSYGLAEATLMVCTKSLSPKYNTLALDKYQLQDGKIYEVKPSHPDAQLFISSGDIDPGMDNVVIIVNPETCMPLADENIGEIWVSGGSVNKGYWELPKAYQENFNANLATGLGSYLKTGDLGFIKQGQLYVTGRVKDLVIIRGKNYYPQDIEYAVEFAHKDIRSGCINIFSVDINDEEMLAILAEVNTGTDYTEISNAIIKQVMEQHNLMPAMISLLSPKSLKKTTSGKLRRIEMKKRYLNGELPLLFTWKQANLPDILPKKGTEKEEAQVPATQSLDNITTSVINVVKKTNPNANMREINMDITLQSLGFDSLLLAELISNLKTEFPGAKDLSIQEFMENKPTIEWIIEKVKLRATDKSHDKASQQSELRKCYSEAEQQYWMDIRNMEDYTALSLSREILGEKNMSQLFFNVVHDVSDNTVTLDSQNFINYSGYNYLGYAGDERVIAATNEALTHYGTSVSASRLVSGQKPIHHELEQEIASFIGAEDAVVFSAGHATNVSVITHLYGNEDVIFHDVLIHNSSLKGAVFSGAKRIPFPHNDYHALEALMEKERPYYRRALVLIEGVYSMDGDIPNVPEFVKVKNDFNADLMIDEAHSMGVLGAGGGGVREYFNMKADDVEIWMGTLSKAFASCGGYIAGKHVLIDFIKYSCDGFVFSAGISPANAAAALKSIRLLRQEPFRPQQLQQCAAKLLNNLKEAGVNVGDSLDTPIIPIIVGDEKKAVDFCLTLRKKGIYAMPIVYPAVEKGMARVRLFVNYMHTEAQITHTTQIICEHLE